MAREIGGNGPKGKAKRLEHLSLRERCKEPPMKLHYYPDSDSLYIELKSGPGVETREVSDGLNVDLDVNGAVVGFDIDHASRLDLQTLETVALPVKITWAA